MGLFLQLKSCKISKRVLLPKKGLPRHSGVWMAPAERALARCGRCGSGSPRSVGVGRGLAWQGRLGYAGPGLPCHDSVGRGRTGLGVAWQGRLDAAMHDLEGRGVTRRGFSAAEFGMLRRGGAGRDLEGQGRARLGR